MSMVWVRLFSSFTHNPDRPSETSPGTTKGGLSQGDGHVHARLLIATINARADVRNTCSQARSN